MNSSPPSELLGSWLDDYGSTHEIGPSLWSHLPSAEYRITKWNETAGFLIARNGANNPSDANLWTRIDWIKLEGMAPYAWAFCLSAYKEPTAAAAEAVTSANRETPKTGCSGFPFTRLKPSH